MEKKLQHFHTKYCKNSAKSTGAVTPLSIFLQNFCRNSVIISVTKE